jgi:hypothetical protein
MTVMKMHHEIEKILEAKETEGGSRSEPTPEPEKPFKPLIQSLFESFFGAERD